MSASVDGLINTRDPIHKTGVSGGGAFQYQLPNDTIEWRNAKGELHNEDGPAIIPPDHNRWQVGETNADDYYRKYGDPSDYDDGYGGCGDDGGYSGNDLAHMIDLVEDVLPYYLNGVEYSKSEFDRKVAALTDTLANTPTDTLADSFTTLTVDVAHK